MTGCRDSSGAYGCFAIVTSNCCRTVNGTSSIYGCSSCVLVTGCTNYIIFVAMSTITGVFCVTVCNTGRSGYSTFAVYVSCIFYSIAIGAFTTMLIIVNLCPGAIIRISMIAYVRSITLIALVVAIVDIIITNGSILFCSTTFCFASVVVIRSTISINRVAKSVFEAMGNRTNYKILLGGCVFAFIKESFTNGALIMCFLTLCDTGRSLRFNECAVSVVDHTNYKLLLSGCVLLTVKESFTNGALIMCCLTLYNTGRSLRFNECAVDVNALPGNRKLIGSEIKCKGIFTGIGSIEHAIACIGGHFPTGICYLIDSSTISKPSAVFNKFKFIFSLFENNCICCNAFNNGERLGFPTVKVTCDYKVVMNFVSFKSKVACLFAIAIVVDNHVMSRRNVSIVITVGVESHLLTGPSGTITSAAIPRMAICTFPTCSIIQLNKCTSTFVATVNTGCRDFFGVAITTSTSVGLNACDFTGSRSSYYTFAVIVNGCTARITHAIAVGINVSTIGSICIYHVIEEYDIILCNGVTACRNING